MIFGYLRVEKTFDGLKMERLFFHSLVLGKKERSKLVRKYFYSAYAEYKAIAACNEAKGPWFSSFQLKMPHGKIRLVHKSIYLRMVSYSHILDPRQVRNVSMVTPKIHWNSSIHTRTQYFKSYSTNNRRHEKKSDSGTWRTHNAWYHVFGDLTFA